MRDSPLITDSDLARARQDSGFRQQLLTESLELLLGELGKLQRAANNTNNERAEQVREGVELAVKLAELLRRAKPNAVRPA
jgi:hypothetical protein